MRGSTTSPFGPSVTILTSSSGSIWKKFYRLYRAVEKSPLPLFSKEGLKAQGTNSPFDKGRLKGNLSVIFTRQSFRVFYVNTTLSQKLQNRVYNRAFAIWRYERTISSNEGSGMPFCKVGSRSSSRFPLGSKK